MGPGLSWYCKGCHCTRWWHQCDLYLRREHPRERNIVWAKIPHGKISPQLLKVRPEDTLSLLQRHMETLVKLRLQNMQEGDRQSRLSLCLFMGLPPNIGRLLHHTENVVSDRMHKRIS